MIGTLVVVVVTALIFAPVLVAAASGERNRWRELLERFAAALGGEADLHTRRVSGALRGVPTTIHLAERGGGGGRDWSSTVIECRLPAGYPLSLHLRRQRTVDTARIRAGQLTDLLAGDAVFDAHFLIDGAPAEVVRRLLVPEVRGYLLAHSDLELETDGGLLRLRLPGWVDADDGIAAIECVAGLAARLRDATAAADAAHPGAVTGGPYRPVVDDAPIRDARAARAEEVARADARRRTRHLHVENYTIASIVIIVIVLAIFASR
jgi:hypothetical protein